MSDFYRLSIEERSERMRRLAIAALKHWDIPDAEPVLVKLRENAVFRVAGPDGRPAALRIHRHGYHTDAALESELLWMQALKADGIDVPGVVPTRTGALFVTVDAAGVPEPRQVDMLEWLPGEPFGTLEEGLSDAVTDIRAAFTGVGALAARLHNHAATWPRPVGFVRHAWDLDGLVGEAPLWGPFWELADLRPDQRALIERARAEARRDLIAYGQSPETYGLIHADFNLDNLIWDNGRIRVVDFDDTGFGWHLFDLATISILFRGKEAFEPIWESVVAGYREHRALPDEQIAHMPLFYLVRAFTYLGWVHTRHETQTAQQIAPMVVALACGLAEEYLSR